ncbi:hypothetical protein [Streptomyces avermitilis]|uniref:hypothetical protein n=1 Tax=Streptomyces avermitilis TaxID=33903 RepID=UPI0038103C39
MLAVIYYCSLKTTTPQRIAADGAYHIVRFPFGAGESTDDHNMHAVQSVADWTRDDRSGLIWPKVSGHGVLSAMVQWEPGGYTELRDRFVRDPFGEPDTTATDHRPPSPGMQAFTKVWQIQVDPTTPLALAVAHNDSSTRAVTLAEFKLAIFA